MIAEQQKIIKSKFDGLANGHTSSKSKKSKDRKKSTDGNFFTDLQFNYAATNEKKKEHQRYNLI